MEFKKRLAVGIFAVAGFAYFTAEVQEKFDISEPELQSRVENQERGWDKAEDVVIDTDVKPDDEPKGPHPDPDKCICEGTGKIVQGDGHISACPYHGQREEPSLDERSQETDVCGCGCGKQGCECQNQGPLSYGPFRKFRK